MIDWRAEADALFEIPDEIRDDDAERFLFMWQRVCESSADVGLEPPLTAEQAGMIYDLIQRTKERTARPA